MLSTVQTIAIIAPMLGLVAVALLWGPDRDPDADIEAVARGTGVVRDDLTRYAIAAEAARAAEQRAGRWWR